jgi:ribonuclease BN (tRNA processing enzyme)
MRCQAIAVIAFFLLAPSSCKNETPPEITSAPRVEVALDPPAPATRVVLLGTGTPNPDPDCSGPAVAVVVGNEAYLVDLGAGVVRRVAAAYRTGVDALNPERITRAFITHLHSDHTLGYPDFIFTPWVIGRDRPMDVYGPPGLQHMTDKIIEAWEQDIKVREESNQPNRLQGYNVNVHEISPGEIYHDGNIRVSAFAVRHGAWKHAYGYRFDASDRSVVISGDTSPAQSVVEACNGCDVLVHEVYSTAGLNARPIDWQAYHKAAHTSSLELAAIATRAKPKLLVLYHQLKWGMTGESILAEVKSKYDGEVVYGRDLDVL